MTQDHITYGPSEGASVNTYITKKSTLDTTDTEDVKGATHVIRSVTSKLKFFTSNQDLQSSSNHTFKIKLRHSLVTDKFFSLIFFLLWFNLHRSKMLGLWLSFIWLVGWLGFMGVFKSTCSMHKAK